MIAMKLKYFVKLSFEPSRLKLIHKIGILNLIGVITMLYVYYFRLWANVERI